VHGNVNFFASLHLINFLKLYPRRVAELEQENKRLLALTQLNQGQHQTGAAAPPDMATLEVELLKAQLAAAQERARSLSAQLEQRSETNSSTVIKVEPIDDLTVPSASSPPRSSMGLPSAHKSSASLGLMVRAIGYWSSATPYLHLT